jgi:hypothetical protein
MKWTDYKFRGKAETGDEWVFGELLQQTVRTGSVTDQVNPLIHNNGNVRVRPETVGMFSGKCDRNGEEVYNGDIFAHHPVGGETVYGVVRYRTEYEEFRKHNCCGFVIEWNEDNLPGRLREDLPYWCLEKSRAHKVGNITDNPELMEV